MNHQNHIYDRSQRKKKDFTPVYVWGSDGCGQLGLATQQIGQNYPVPKFCSFNVIINSLSCGQEHTSFIAENGFVYSMGNNSSGQLGLGKKQILAKSAPTMVQALSKYKALKISSGANHTAVLTRCGKVYTWGMGAEGQLGSGDIQNSFSPFHVRLPKRDIVEIQCGKRNTMAITKQHQLYGWGDGQYGQLGHGSSSNELTPIEINLNFRGLRKVSCGDTHTLFLSKRGEVFACGNNQLGQLGTGSRENTNQPKNIFIAESNFEATKFSKIYASHSTFSAALTERGEVYLWGSGFFGESQIPAKLDFFRTPQKELGVGCNFMSFLDANGVVFTWGNNLNGELGIGEGRIMSMDAPVQITSLNNRPVNNIYCGANFMFALGVQQEINSQMREKRRKFSETLQISSSSPSGGVDSNNKSALGGRHFLTQTHTPSHKQRNDVQNIIDFWPNSANTKSDLNDSFIQTDSPQFFTQGGFGGQNTQNTQDECNYYEIRPQEDYDFSPCCDNESNLYFNQQNSDNFNQNCNNQNDKSFINNSNIHGINSIMPPGSNSSINNNYNNNRNQLFATQPQMSQLKSINSPTLSLEDSYIYEPQFSMGFNNTSQNFSASPSNFKQAKPNYSGFGGETGSQEIGDCSSFRQSLNFESVQSNKQSNVKTKGLSKYLANEEPQLQEETSGQYQNLNNSNNSYHNIQNFSNSSDCRKASTNFTPLNFNSKTTQNVYQNNNQQSLNQTQVIQNNINSLGEDIRSRKGRTLSCNSNINTTNNNKTNNNNGNNNQMNKSIPTSPKKSLHFENFMSLENSPADYLQFDTKQIPNNKKPLNQRNIVLDTFSSPNSLSTDYWANSQKNAKNPLIDDISNNMQVPYNCLSNQNSTNCSPISNNRLLPFSNNSKNNRDNTNEQQTDQTRKSFQPINSSLDLQNDSGSLVNDQNKASSIAVTMMNNNLKDLEKKYESLFLDLENTKMENVELRKKLQGEKDNNQQILEQLSEKSQICHQLEQKYEMLRIDMQMSSKSNESQIEKLLIEINKIQSKEEMTIFTSNLGIKQSLVESKIVKEIKQEVNRKQEYETHKTAYTPISQNLQTFAAENSRDIVSAQSGSLFNDENAPESVTDFTSNHQKRQLNLKEDAINININYQNIQMEKQNNFKENFNQKLDYLQKSYYENLSIKTNAEAQPQVKKSTSPLPHSIFTQQDKNKLPDNFSRKSPTKTNDFENYEKRAQNRLLEYLNKDSEGKGLKNNQKSNQYGEKLFINTKTLPDDGQQVLQECNNCFGNMTCPKTTNSNSGKYYQYIQAAIQNQNQNFNSLNVSPHQNDSIYNNAVRKNSLQQERTQSYHSKPVSPQNYQTPNSNQFIETRFNKKFL